jgi:prepilin-type processing-associated H-X9-DG protein
MIMNETRKNEITNSRTHRRLTRLRSGMTWLELVVVLGVIAAVVCLLLPTARRRTPARRVQCQNNLKQIGLALWNYEDKYGAFPPAYSVDADGRPLHSWRTLILPFVDEKELYESIDLSKPWNDPANATAHKAMPSLYSCPSTNVKGGLTTYLALVGKSCFFQETKPRLRSEVTDGMSNSIMVMEVSRKDAVHWMSPQDIGIDFATRFGGSVEVAHTGGAHVLYADGSARFISLNVPTDALRARFTIDTGDFVLDDY